MKKIQIYYNKKYLPFDLYINSIYDIFKTNEYFIQNQYEVSIIDNICHYSQDTDYLILFLNYIRDIFYIDTNNTKIIFIHADCIINHSQDDQNMIHHYLNHKNINNSYLWEYNYLNIDYYNQHYINKKWYFIPLQYNNYLESIYNQYKLNIPYHNKKIDVLFMGNTDPGSRRQLLLDEISKICNLYIMKDIHDINRYIDIIENSKMIVHIYAKEFNKSFDYYRLSLLYSNKILVVSEKTENEHNLPELKGIMIEEDYHNIINTITTYLNKKDEEIKSITEKTYEIFKKKNMNDFIIDFFFNNN